MSLTPEQVAANETFREALVEWLRVSADIKSVLTEFVVIGSGVDYDDDGQALHTHFAWHTEESYPNHRLLGLVEAAAARYRARAAEDIYRGIDEDD